MVGILSQGTDMDETDKQALLDAHHEAARVVAQSRLVDLIEARRGRNRGTVVRRGDAVLDPAKFWAAALSSGGTLAQAEDGLRLAAARLKAGDTAFVIESATGQLAWLSALAVEMKEKADKAGSANAFNQFMALALRAQGAAAKLALSLAALNKLDGAAVVTVGD